MSNDCQSTAPREPTKRAVVLLTTALCFTCVLYGGCAATPAQYAAELAHDGGAAQIRVAGIGFDHVVFSRGVDAHSKQLHIYFGGDGTPLIHGRQISSDPTARDPLGLELMLADPQPSLYVGRPCYEGLASARNCAPILWTLQRYGEPIVASMTAVVEWLVAQSPAAEVTLIGYSGGGVLAVLVAERVTRIGTVVTIAANLDIDAWTDLHHYSRLIGSINPAARTQWRSSLRQVHFVGASDDNVTPTIVRQFAAAVPGAEVNVVEGFDHRCCWRAQWPVLLDSALRRN